MSATPLAVPARERLLARLDLIDVRLVFAVLAVLAVVPVLWVKVPPMSDYVNHLARMHVIAVGQSDPYLSQFYRIEWQLIPNLAMDLVVPVLARVMDVYTAGQLFMVGILFLLASGPMAISYALHRRFSFWPLASFLFLYNQVFLVGLTNYLAGAGFAMWGLAIWIMIRDRALALRIAVSAFGVLLLYVCHLSALGLYGLAIGSYELWAWWKRGHRFDLRLAKDFAALALPVVPVVPLLLGSATWGLAAEYEWTASGKFDGLMLIFRAYDDMLDLGILALLAISFGWAVRRQLIVFHPAALVFAVVGGAAFMAVPSILFGSYMADQRLPIAIFLMLIGFGRLRSTDRVERTAFLALVFTFATIRYADIAVHWDRLSRVYREFTQATRLIEPGAKILVSYADEPQSSENDQEALAHAACIGMIERSALVSTAFTVPGKQIMRVRKEFRNRVDTEDGTPPTISRLIASTAEFHEPTGNYWENWRINHDYVVVLYTARGADNPQPDMLSLAYDGDGFQLYRVIRETTE